ncbi:MBL fold metallo-hydrolase [Halarcobacter sp.]|uniref:MBL fold metallo-hydrolase n=1 Tax=Halarcobacter sp. TaxID=2321133 RepID=UPI003A8E863D
MKLKFLGTADSAGIPVHNCTCNVCNKYRKNNIQNLATSAYLEIEDKIILLDAGVENISTIFDGKEIKAIFLTHFHADHCLGLLKLRHSKDTIKCFHPNDKDGFSDLFKHTHSILYNKLDEFESVCIDNISFTAIPLVHSKKCNGYLIEYKNHTIAYLTDTSKVSEKVIKFLKSKKLDYCFIDACYDERKEVGNHLNYFQASKILNSLNVKNGYLMHISHTTQDYIEKNKVSLKYKYLKNEHIFVFD